jgi:exonuclease III
MKILVWNVRRATKTRNGVWEYFQEIAPDIALLQEVGSLPSSISSEYSILQRSACARDGKYQKFHTVLLAKGSLMALDLTTPWEWVNNELQNYAGNLITAQVSLNSGKVFRVMSVYSPAWPIFSREKFNEIDVTNIKLKNNPDIWLTELMWAALLNQDMNEFPWIVAGDLNSSVTFDTMWKGGPRGNQEIQDRMTTLGFTECLRYFQGALTPTFKNPYNQKVIHQMDHLFIKSDMVGHLLNCSIGDSDRVFGGSLSDHLPIIAELKISV